MNVVEFSCPAATVTLVGLTDAFVALATTRLTTRPPWGAASDRTTLHEAESVCGIPIVLGVNEIVTVFTVTTVVVDV